MEEPAIKDEIGAPEEVREEIGEVAQDADNGRPPLSTAVSMLLLTDKFRQNSSDSHSLKLFNTDANKNCQNPCQHKVINTTHFSAAFALRSASYASFPLR